MSPDSDVHASIKSAINNLLKAIQDAAQLDVKTHLLFVDKAEDDPEQGKKVAQTELLLDGDANVWVPVETTSGEVALKQELYEIHNQNVEKAIQRRSELLDAAKGLVGELKNLLE